MRETWVVTEEEGERMIMAHTELETKDRGVEWTLSKRKVQCH